MNGVAVVLLIAYAVSMLLCYKYERERDEAREELEDLRREISSLKGDDGDAGI